MIEDKLPQTLDEVREAIDGLDKGLIELLAAGRNWYGRLVV